MLSSNKIRAGNFTISEYLIFAGVGVCRKNATVLRNSSSKLAGFVGAVLKEWHKAAGDVGGRHLGKK